MIFSQDPETMNRTAVRLGEYLGHSWLKRPLEKTYHFEDPGLEQELLGLKFRNPVGLAAGFDKAARMVDFLPALGFGHVEIGSVTPQPQEGNPKPRAFRLEEDEALINRMGFNSEGAAVIADRLRLVERKLVVGVNIGKNRNTPNEKAVPDYEEGFRIFAPIADYITINISSPNTPGLRDLLEKGPLRELLGALQKLNAQLAKQVPLLLKVPPDSTATQLDDIMEVAKETQIHGLIAVNTTLARTGLRTAPATLQAIGAGGLSGEPLKNRATEVIRYLYRGLGRDMAIVGSGGIFSAADAYEKIKAGASLVEFYTGLVYEGPGLVKKINKGLSRLLKRDGFSSMREAVGKDAR